MAEKLVIIGNGMAPGRMLEHLLDADPARYDITIFNAEPRVNYNRLMLSPVLAGEKTFADIITHDDHWYASHNITLHKAAPVSLIDRVNKRVLSTNSVVADYDRLVIATGSNPFVPPLPGTNLPGVITFRDLDNVEAMIAASACGGHAVILGGGILGLEAAAALRLRGMAVTVLHRSANIMERQLDPAAGKLLARALVDRGITILTNAHTAEIIGPDCVTAIRLNDGSEIPADLFVMAVGIAPNTGLARAAGLAVNRGIVVDDQMRTDDPHIYALGECAEHRGQCYGLVAPLYDMAETLAQTLLGAEAVYNGSLTATRLKVTGIDVFSAGDFKTAPDREDIVLHDASAGIYKRLILKNDRLIGAVLYGETADGPWFFDLIQGGADTRAMRDTLIFGPSYQGSAPLDPMVAVAASQDNLRCNGLNSRGLRTVGLLPSLPLERRVAPLGPSGRSKAGVGVVLFSSDGPPPSFPPLKGEGGEGTKNTYRQAA